MYLFHTLLLTLLASFSAHPHFAAMDSVGGGMKSITVQTNAPADSVGGGMKSAADSVGGGMTSAADSVGGGM